MYAEKNHINAVKIWGQQHTEGKRSAAGISRAQGKKNAESKRLTLGSTLLPTPGYKNVGIYIINMQRFFYFIYLFIFTHKRRSFQSTTMSNSTNSAGG